MCLLTGSPAECCYQECLEAILSARCQTKIYRQTMAICQYLLDKVFNALHTKLKYWKEIQNRSKLLTTNFITTLNCHDQMYNQTDNNKNFAQFLTAF